MQHIKCKATHAGAEEMCQSQRASVEKHYREEDIASNHSRYPPIVQPTPPSSLAHFNGAQTPARSQMSSVLNVPTAKRSSLGAHETVVTTWAHGRDANTQRPSGFHTWWRVAGAHRLITNTVHAVTSMSTY